MMFTLLIATVNKKPLLKFTFIIWAINKVYVTHCAICKSHAMIDLGLYGTVL